MPKLLPELPEDPFTGLDLAYRRTEKGYLVYSVGRDRQDDDGLDEKHKKKSTERKTYDLTFVVNR